MGGEEEQRCIKEEGPVAGGRSGTENTSVATNSGEVGWGGGEG